MASPIIFEEEHALIVCEGSAEKAIIQKLLSSSRCILSWDRVVEITGTRGAKAIQDEFLNYDYDYPVRILRILDSKKEAFRLGALYRDRYPVTNIYTRPEIEMLNIIKEGHYQAYTTSKKSHSKPSQYCIEVLGMSNIKTKGFAEEYWDLESLEKAILDYKQLKKIPKDESCLADLLKD